MFLFVTFHEESTFESLPRVAQTSTNQFTTVKMPEQDVRKPCIRHTHRVDFQTELAGYFKSLAVYDNERANQDLAGARYWYVIGTVSMKRYKRKNEKSSRYAC